MLKHVLIVSLIFFPLSISSQVLDYIEATTTHALLKDPSELIKLIQTNDPQHEAQLNFETGKKYLIALRLYNQVIPGVSGHWDEPITEYDGIEVHSIINFRSDRITVAFQRMINLLKSYLRIYNTYIWEVHRND